MFPSMFNILFLLLPLVDAGQRKIVEDNDENGLIFRKIGQYQVASDAYALQYSYDTKVIQEIESMSKTLNKADCFFNTQILQQFNEQLRIKNNLLSAVHINNRTNTNIALKIEHPEITSLNNFIKEINNEDMINNCPYGKKSLIELTKKIELLNTEIRKLTVEKKLEKTLESRLKRDIISTRFDDGFFPYFRLHKFMEQLLKISSITFHISPMEMVITIEIPVLTKEMYNLFAVSQKPSIVNEFPVIVNIMDRYLLANSNKSKIIAFKNIEKCMQWNGQNVCFLNKERVTYEHSCEIHTLANNNSVRNSLNKYCLYNSLPKQNMITQIENDVYFTIYTPLNINVACKGEKSYNVTLTRHSKLTNATHCILYGKNFVTIPLRSIDHITILSPVILQENMQFDENILENTFLGLKKLSYIISFITIVATLFCCLKAMTLYKCSLGGGRARPRSQTVRRTRSDSLPDVSHPTMINESRPVIATTPKEVPFNATALYTETSPTPSAPPLTPPQTPYNNDFDANTTFVQVLKKKHVDDNRDKALPPKRPKTLNVTPIVRAIPLPRLINK